MCPAGEIHGKPLARKKPHTPSWLSAVLYQPAVLGVTARNVSSEYELTFVLLIFFFYYELTSQFSNSLTYELAFIK